MSLSQIRSQSGLLQHSQLVNFLGDQLCHFCQDAFDRQVVLPLVGVDQTVVQGEEVAGGLASGAQQVKVGG